jgi:amidase
MGSAYDPSRIVDMDAVELSDAIRGRRVSCREVMQAYLEQIDRVNPQVNAIVSLQDRESLMRQAGERDRELAGGRWLGWMHGFPQAPKDFAATVGIPTTLGSPILKDNIPRQDAIIVERIKRSGAIIIGKTNTPEFGLGSHTYNNVFGITRNAYDQSRTAGGSSGGAAVALATRMLPVADGSDMMGSLRNPAAYNNVFGFRPPVGRVPYGPTLEVFYQQLAYEGPMVRTVRDLAMLLSVQAGYDERTPLSIKEDPAIFAQPLGRGFKDVRVAWLGDLGGYLPMEPGIIELCRQALKYLEEVGCVVEEVSLDYPPERLWQTWLTLRAFLVSGNLSVFYAEPRTRAMMKPEAVWEAERGAKISTSELYQASVNRSAWYAYLRTLYEKYDYLVLPTAQVFPFAAEIHWPKEVGGKAMDTYHRWMEVVIPASLAGVPAISVPVGFSADGLPMGMQIVGKPQGDLAVLQLAYAYEQAAAGVIRRKPAIAGWAS